MREIITANCLTNLAKQFYSLERLYGIMQTFPSYKITLEGDKSDALTIVVVCELKQREPKWSLSL